jgi:tetratricopeptide (TPR) repeat protein
MPAPLRALPLLSLLWWSALSPLAHGESLLDQGKRLCREGRFTEAVQTLSTAIATIEGERDTPQRGVRLADAYLHLGFSHAALGELAPAKEAFRRVLALAPDRHLDPEIHAPKLVDLFEEARLATLAEQPRAATRDRDARFAGPPSRIFAEAGIAASGRLHFGGEPAPSYTESANESSYRLQLRSHASGATSAVRLGLNLFGGRDRAEARFAWGTLRASDAPLSRATAATLDFRLNPPAAKGNDEWRMRVLDVTWSRRLTVRGRLTTRLEIGYRYFHAHQRALDLVQDSRCAEIAGDACLYVPDTPVMHIRRERRERESEVHDHGLRGGLDLDLSLFGRWRLVARTGLALLTRRERETISWSVTDRFNTEPRRRGPQELPAYAGRHVTYDLSTGVRVALAPRAWALLSYQLQEFGPDTRALPRDRVTVGGLSLVVGYALGR